MDSLCGINTMTQVRHDLVRSRLLRDDFEGAANIWWQWRRGGPCQVYSARPSEAPRDGERAISELILGGGRLYFLP